MPDASPPLPRPEIRDTIGAVLGRTPSGLFVLTSRSADGRETGLLASWVQQASFEPPMITVAVNRKRFLHDWLAKAPLVALNLIGEGQKQFLKHFGAGFEPGAPAFEGLHIRRGETGVPILAEALGYLEGRICGQMETGDHVVYAVEILAAGEGPGFAEAAPWVHVRKNGFNY
uniref:Flavin reductase n=1 Tax=Schlesneria paludicola TaxID=360056 RepID=A0A7C2P3S9_9PLAN